MAASAPAITGRFCIDPFDVNGIGVHSQIGAFYTTTVTGTPNPYAAYGSNSARPTTSAGTFAASRSSSINGASNTVRPLSYQTKFMIRF